MSVDSFSYKINHVRKWAVGWYLINSILSGLTLLALARLGYVPFDDVTAFLVGFIVPIIIYGGKEKMGLYRYQKHLVVYQYSEVILQRAAGDFGHGKYEDALTKFESVLECMPDHRRALYYAAISAERLGKKELAAKYYTDYLSIVPDDGEVREKLEALSPAV
jgi:tetratricopeptide (TPR) repeat protein